MVLNRWATSGVTSGANYWAKAFQPHPLRLLLYLEWLLLSLTVLLLVGGFQFGNMTWLGESILTMAELPRLIAILAAFALMGLQLPQTQTTKFLYLGLEFALLAAASAQLNWGLDYLAPLLIVIVLRSCFAFEQWGRWLMAGVMTVIYGISRLPFLSLWYRFDPDRLTEIAAPDSPLQILPDQTVQLTLPAAAARQILESTRNLFFQWLWGNGLLFVLGVILLLLLVNALVSERQGRRQLALAHEQLYQYSLQIDQQSALQERTRIARELHDSLGHLLTAQSLQLQSAAMVLASNKTPLAPAQITEAQDFLADSQRFGANALKELRQTLMLLRSDPLQGQTLETAVTLLVEEFARITGLCPETDLEVGIKLPQRLQVAIYRIVEEALTNIQKHSQATQVTLRLNIQTDADLHRFLCLQITDNGSGFDLEGNRTGFGLRGMEERALSLGGSFQIHSQPSIGCQITVSLPLEIVT
jgi:signal transduction histidine kinase